MTPFHHVNIEKKKGFSYNLDKPRQTQVLLSFEYVGPVARLNLFQKMDFFSIKQLHALIMKTST